MKMLVVKREGDETLWGCLMYIPEMIYLIHPFGNTHESVLYFVFDYTCFPQLQCENNVSSMIKPEDVSVLCFFIIQILVVLTYWCCF